MDSARSAVQDLSPSDFSFGKFEDDILKYFEILIIYYQKHYREKSGSISIREPRRKASLAVRREGALQRPRHAHKNKENAFTTVIVVCVRSVISEIVSHLIITDYSSERSCRSIQVHSEFDVEPDSQSVRGNVDWKFGIPNKEILDLIHSISNTVYRHRHTTPSSDTNETAQSVYTSLE